MRSNQMLAFGFENILFLLLIAVALLFQLLSRVASASKDSEAEETEPEPESPLHPRTPPPPIPRPRPKSDQERIREFLEALGQPRTAPPPPRIQPRPRPSYKKPVVLPHVPPFGSPLPPLTTRPPELPREIYAPPQSAPPGEAKVFKPKPAEAEPVFEVHEAQMPVEPPPVPVRTAAEAYAVATQPAMALHRPPTDIITLLRSTSGLREAILLREILGPPRSMQPLESIGNV